MSYRGDVYFVTEEEYRKLVREKQIYSPSFRPVFQLLVIHEFDMYTGIYNVVKLNGGPLNEFDKTTTADVKDFFKKGQSFYITSNGVIFYKVLDIHVGKQRLLEFSLLKLINNRYAEPDHAFMVMPFKFHLLNNFYKEHIKSILKEDLGISIFRADDFTDNDTIVDTIYKEIERAEFILCEITHCNKNVFYEIGYAKAIGKELIFLLQKGEEHNFFDTAHIRRIEYSLDDIISFQLQLKGTIESIRSRN